MPAQYFTMATGCDAGAGYVDILTLTGGATGADYTYELTGDAGGSYGGGVVQADLPLRLAPLANDHWKLLVRYENPDGSGNSSYRTFDTACSTSGGGGGGGGGPAALVLDKVSATDETSAGSDGTATIQASGGTAPLTALLVTTGATKAATAGQPATFAGLPGGADYKLRVTDSGNPAQVVEGTVHVAGYVAPAVGCQDEYADNYDPSATSGGAASCTYTPLWRSAWGPAGMSVRVAAVAGQVAAFISAKLRVGFRPGHPQAADRPLADVATLRATVGPDGYATFVLAPYVRPLLGAPDGAAGYRLDLNSPEAFGTDLYVGYELRRADSGALLEHGYALNAAVPDAELVVFRALSPFWPTLPTWPGFEEYPVSYLTAIGPGGTTRYGQVAIVSVDSVVGVTPQVLPCPPNPLPVAWLAPGGGYGIWIFQGKPLLADTIEAGSTYQEGATGERRYSERGAARRSYTASSGPFRGAALAEGLATLARSPQVWVQPVAGGPWVAVTLEAGTFPVQRWGVSRNELTGITFTEAAAQYAQGQ